MDRRAVIVVLVALIAGASARAQPGLRLNGQIVDADTQAPLASRIYIRGSDGTWHFAKSASAAGSAVEYRKQRGAASVEMHTTLSAHPFTAELPPGQYTVTVERGKEYFTHTQSVELRDGPREVRTPLRRWIDLSARGWYSGETHVHRGLDELPNAMLADDLNVAFPLLHWVTKAFSPPGTSAKSSAAAVQPTLIHVDPTHVIYPLNTEYEIFTVGGHRHTLGAFFVLNHRRVFEQGVPPVGPIAEQAHRQGGLIELDKHAWPWSMALVPIMQVDLFELTNNHVWRTTFGFRGWGEPAADYMQIERDAQGWTERGWIDYGLANYYALLNCGFRLRPTAGTASGVHPVPLGFGRVYVHLADGFSYDAWVRGLNAGRSFVTTGPMLFVKVNGRDPGTTLRVAASGRQRYRVTGSAVSAERLTGLEIVVNGEVIQPLGPRNRRTDRGAFESPFDESLELDRSSWIAVRCFTTPAAGRVRFAHSSPVHIDVAGRPLRPRQAEVAYLIQRVEAQIARSRDRLPPAALDEYRRALAAYRRIAQTARKP